MPCVFISELSRLRKSSAESVENTTRFDEYKEYLHVERSVEEELRLLLRQVNTTSTKSLVLLCGSAGDGKSHLISYFKNYDDENLLADYETYNDATESSEPTLTSIDTLATKLSEYNDANYNNGHPKKMIIAINLGTLSNFIESEKGKQYTKLKEFVTNNNILSGYRHDTGYFNNSVFQLKSFCSFILFDSVLNTKSTSEVFKSATL